MLTNDLKKGALVKLANGLVARIEDNEKGNVRMATIFRDYTEMGSIYAHNIVEAMVDNVRVPIEYTQAQLDCKHMNKHLFR